MGIEAGQFMQLAGAAGSAVGSYKASQGTKAAYEAQAQIAENNAVIAGWQAADAERRGALKATQSRIQYSQLKGSQRAAMAANGIELSVGTAQNILNDADQFGQVDANTIIDNAAREAWGYRVQASNYHDNASLLQSRADAESPLMAAGTSLLGSAGKVAASWYGTDKRGGSTGADPLAVWRRTGRGGD